MKKTIYETFADDAEIAFQSDRSVLSVDDDPVNQMVIASLFESEGYTVFQAMDGPEALQFLAGRPFHLPDIILLDVMMPGMSGYEVLDAIRRLYPSDLPVIMISAKVSVADKVEGLLHLCQDYQCKPFEKRELVTRAKNLIILRRMRAWSMARQSLKCSISGSLPTHVVDRVMAVEDSSAVNERHACTTFLSCIVDVADEIVIATIDTVYKAFLFVMAGNGNARIDVLPPQSGGFELLAVCGLTHNAPAMPEQTVTMCTAALRFLSVLENMKPGLSLCVKLGISSGSGTVGSLLSDKTFALFSDNRTHAYAVARSGAPGTVSVTPDLVDSCIDKFKVVESGSFVFLPGVAGGGQRVGTMRLLREGIHEISTASALVVTDRVDRVNELKEKISALKGKLGGLGGGSCDGTHDGTSAAADNDIDFSTGIFATAGEPLLEFMDAMVEQISNCQEKIDSNSVAIKSVMRVGEKSKTSNHARTDISEFFTTDTDAGTLYCGDDNSVDMFDILGGGGSDAVVADTNAELSLLIAKSEQLLIESRIALLRSVG